MSTIFYYREDNMVSQNMRRTLDAVREPYIPVQVGSDMLMEDFLQTYPSDQSLPLVIMNGQKFNDHRALKEHLLNRPGMLLG